VGERINARLSDVENHIYATIRLAASRGAPCPSNAMLMRISRCQSIGTTSDVVKSLEEKGFIKVKRFQRQRQVEIVKTGQITTVFENTELSTRPHVGKKTQKPNRTWTR